MKKSRINFAENNIKINYPNSATKAVEYLKNELIK